MRQDSSQKARRKDAGPEIYGGKGIFDADGNTSPDTWHKTCYKM